MKPRHSATTAFSLLTLATTALAELPPPNKPVVGKTHDTSIRNEVGIAIDKGLKWLAAQQNPNGSWSNDELPALTAITLVAFMGDPSDKYKKEQPEFIKKGYDFLLGNVRPDGGIYKQKLSNYNTALSLLALVQNYDPKNQKIMLAARNYLVGGQTDLGVKGTADNPFDGGLGYSPETGSKHSDLSNTVVALQALYHSKFLIEGKEKSEAKDLDWNAVAGFIARCQNRSESNKEPWVSDDPADKGGFVYFPGNSMAGERKLPDGKVALRSYGSMTYAGLLSLIYADVKRDDPRVQAAYDWLTKNYTLKENPGMGSEGLYYYFQTQAKALSILGIDKLKLADGSEVDWRHALAKRLFDLQKPEGFWLNDAGRWMEKDPVLVTAYSVIALEYLYRQL